MARFISLYIYPNYDSFLKPVASILGIPLENIFANQVLFGSNGEYGGFDKNEPTSRRGGKATAVQQIRKVGVGTVADIVVYFLKMLTKLSNVPGSWIQVTSDDW